MLLILLADHADEEWSCYPSQERLARDSNQGERTVRRQIGHLRELGLLTTEQRYGESRGRLGMRYYLLRDGLQKLSLAAPAAPESREITRPANLAGKSENREITRPANLAGKSENREITRPANLAGNGSTGQEESIYRPNRASGVYKDRARINHQSVHQSVDAHERADEPPTDGPTDGPTTEERVVHRGVDLHSLRSQVPPLQDWGLPEAQVRRIVDVVLARATTPVQFPTKYVARALSSSELAELVDLTRERPLPAPGGGSERLSRPGGVPGPVAPSAGLSGDSGGSARVTTAGEPCENPEVHVGNYGPSVLRDCPHCRIERRSVPREDVGVGAGRVS